jgi:hypothetical protein
MMTCFSFPRLRRFLKEEDGGTNTIEFAIWTPILLLTLATAVEAGLYTARATMLERGMDMAARSIRLETDTAPQHSEIKAEICQLAAIVPNCEATLRLEMIPRDLRNWQAVPGQADCIDRSEPITPVRAFESGSENELMVLRACSKIEPLFPWSWLSTAIQRDQAGDMALIATSIFVQEPR